MGFVCCTVCCTGCGAVWFLFHGGGAVVPLLPMGDGCHILSGCGFSGCGSGVGVGIEYVEWGVHGVGAGVWGGLVLGVKN